MMSHKKQLLEEGTILNEKWKILRYIDSGSKGEVYLANQENLERDVAIKILSPDFLESLDDEMESQIEIERFKREVQVMARIKHPNVLHIFDFDKVNYDNKDIFILIMEYVPGPTLYQSMPPEGLASDEIKLKDWISDYFFPILDGVDEIHSLGIVHRDMKPGNVLVHNDIPKIADFGLAASKTMSTVTQSHHILGTLPYASEEQFMDSTQADSRADIYSLGKILYEAVSGKMVKETAYMFKTAKLKDPSSKFLKRLNTIIQAATATNVNQRYSSIKVFRRELENLLGTRDNSTEGLARKPKLNHWPWFTAIGVLAVLLIMGIIYHFENTIPSTENIADSQSASVIRPEKQFGDQVNKATASKAYNLDKDNLEQKITGHDGAVLHLIDQNDTVNDEGKKVKTDSFYLEETEVTNHQFVEFLNQVRNNISVKNNVVYGDDEVWLFLGRVSGEYEPVIFKNNKFNVQKPLFAAHPVVRVTAIGATAYAKFYGRYLPTNLQWQLIASLSIQSNKFKNGEIPENQASHDKMMGQSSNFKSQSKDEDIFDFDYLHSREPNNLGIIGTVGGFNEWAVQKTNDDITKFYVFEKRNYGKDEIYLVIRSPWEAFTNVGFRTVINIEN